jgi:hypothetical protein
VFPSLAQTQRAPGLLRLCAAAALRGMEGAVRSTFHPTALTTTVDYCQAVRPGRAAGWSGLPSCVQPLAAPQCGYPPSSTRCAGAHAAWLGGGSQ